MLIFALIPFVCSMLRITHAPSWTSKAQRSGYSVKIETFSDIKLTFKKMELTRHTPAVPVIKNLPSKFNSSITMICLPNSAVNLAEFPGFDNIEFQMTLHVRLPPSLLEIVGDWGDSAPPKCSPVLFVLCRLNSRFRSWPAMAIEDGEKSGRCTRNGGWKRETEDYVMPAVACGVVATGLFVAFRYIW